MSSEFALSPPRKRPMELLRLVGWAVALAFLVWSWRGAEMRPMTLITESGNILTLIKDFFPPDFTDWRLYATEMVVTLQVAIWGTLLAVVCAVPLGILSSDNIVPWWVYHPVRRLMDAARAINEMVFAMLFVVAVGLGPLRGRAGSVGTYHGRPRQAVLRGRGSHRAEPGRRRALHGGLLP